MNKDPKIFFSISLLQNSANASAINSQFSVGGTITGLNGTGLVLQNNGADNNTITGSGAFTFSTKLSDKAAYSISVLTNPSSPSQICSVANGSGTISGSNITNVAVTCQNPSIVFSGSPYTYTVNTAITTNTPTVIGTVTSCSASPSLPAGLSISNTTCAISGTPTVIQGATSYTITVVTDSGNLTDSISITVSAAPAPPSGLTYSSSNYVFKQNTTIPTITPTVTGTVTSCSASPSLPTGLSINNTTCAISGTPTANQASTSYTITASNAGGSTTASFTITIQSSVFKIFVTASTFTGDLKTLGGGATGPDGADNLCNADANKPADGSTYKAIIFTNGLRQASPALNWILQANTTYIRSSDFALIFTSDASGIFSFGTLTNSFDSGAQKEYWTGFRGPGFEWQLGLHRCSEWESASAAVNGRFGLSDSTSYNSISTGTQNNCSLSKYLLCAEQ